MKKLEMKDLTEAEKAEIALLVQKAQANAQVLPDTFSWSDSVSNKYRGRR